VEELKEAKRGSWKARLLAFLLFLLLLIPFFYLDSAVVKIALHKCPDGTFLSGRVHDWSNWAFALLATAIWMLTCDTLAL
jgi:hypothetical protein